jgi:hypothetical protein
VKSFYLHSENLVAITLQIKGYFFPTPCFCFAGVPTADLSEEAIGGGAIIIQ